MGHAPQAQFGFPNDIEVVGGSIAVTGVQAVELQSRVNTFVTAGSDFFSPFLSTGGAVAGTMKIHFLFSAVGRLSLVRLRSFTTIVGDAFNGAILQPDRWYAIEFPVGGQDSINFRYSVDVTFQAEAVGSKL